MSMRRVVFAASVVALLLGGAASASAAKPPASTTLQISVPGSVDLGRVVQVTALLTDDQGLPLIGAAVTFQSTAVWGTTAHGTVTIGTSLTDGQGNAVLAIPFRRTGTLPLTAVFAGDSRHLPSKASTTVTVTGTEQQVQPSVGIHIRGVGIWVLGLVLALVWGSYLAAGARALRIVKLGEEVEPAAGASEGEAGAGADPTRRDFLTHAFPVAIEGTLAVLGGGLLAVIARSPQTHTNQVEDVPAGYDRTPVAYVGKDTPHIPVPATLTREVSFSTEVLPILLSRAGPHVMLPENSPPPGGMRLDSFEHLMMMSPGEGTELVVPGKPEESMLFQVLVDPGMRMPPVGMPLPTNELQIIASWIAQGAKNN